MASINAPARVKPATPIPLVQKVQKPPKSKFTTQPVSLVQTVQPLRQPGRAFKTTSKTTPVEVVFFKVRRHPTKQSATHSKPDSTTSIAPPDMPTATGAKTKSGQKKQTFGPGNTVCAAADKNPPSLKIAHTPKRCVRSLYAFNLIRSFPVALHRPIRRNKPYHAAFECLIPSSRKHHARSYFQRVA